MLAEAVSHTGLVRRNNEDAYVVVPRLNLFAVADGMGGHAAGEVASKLAVNTIAEYIRQYKGSRQPGQVLSDAVTAANREIFSQANAKPSQLGMGTTLSAVWIPDDHAYLAHVGDSRIYLFRDNNIQLLTKDHSFVSEMVRKGNITAEEAKNHPRRNLLTRALGTETDVEVDLSELSLLQDDLLLCCTDGLSSIVSSDELCAILQNKTKISEKLKQMVDLALARGGQDNITVLLVYNFKR